MGRGTNGAGTDRHAGKQVKQNEEYQFSSIGKNKEELKENQHKSKLFRGESTDGKFQLDERKKIIAGVAKNILSRMEDENKASQKEAVEMQQKAAGKVSKIQNGFEPLKTLTAVRKAAEADKERLVQENESDSRSYAENDETIRKSAEEKKSKTSELDSRKERQEQISRLNRQIRHDKRRLRHLEKKEDLSEEEKNERNEKYQTRLNASLEERERISGGEDEKDNEKAIEALRAEIEAAGQAEEQAKSNKEALKNKIHANSEKLPRIEESIHNFKRQIEDRKVNILTMIEQENQEWEAELETHKDSAKKHSQNYDELVGYYFPLVRANETGTLFGGLYTKDELDQYGIKIEGSYAKAIAQYVGHLPSTIEQIQEIFSGIERNPQASVEYTVGTKALREGSLNEVANGIKYHHGILLEQKNAQSGAQNVAQGGAQNVSQATEKKANENKLSIEAGLVSGIKNDVDMSKLKVNEKFEGTGQYRYSGASLDIHTTKGRRGKKFYERSETVHGVTIGGKFISDNRALYDTEADAGIGQGYKVDPDGGTYKKQEELENEMMDSPFFQHIFAENVEQYIKYSGDELDLVSAAMGHTLNSNQVREETVTVQAGQPGQTQTTKYSINLADPAVKTEEGYFGALYQYAVNDSNSYDKVKNLVENEKNGKQKFVAKRLLVPRLVRLMLVAPDTSDTHKKRVENAVGLAKDLGEGNVKEMAGVISSGNVKQCQGLIMACDQYEKGSKFLSVLEKAVLSDDGVEMNNFANGLISYDLFSNIYDGAVEVYNMTSGLTARWKNVSGELKDLENKNYVEGSKAYKENQDKITAKREELEEIEGKMGDTGGVFTRGKGIFEACLGVISAAIEVFGRIKEGSLLSDEHREEAELRSLYVGKWDKFFDTVSMIFDLVGSLHDLITGSWAEIEQESSDYKTASGLGPIYNTIREGFAIVQNSYQLGRNIQKSSNISEKETAVKSMAGNAENSQVMQVLGAARRYTNKQISENSIDIGTGALKIASEWTDPVTSTILGLATRGIDIVGKMITNTVYNRAEEKSVMQLAFGSGREKEIESGYSRRRFDSALQKAVGINSKRSLSQVSRIISAIDMHVLLRKAPVNPESNEWKLAKTAMGAFYKFVWNPGNPRGNYGKIPLSALMGQIGESDWRSSLQKALVPVKEG